MYNLHDLSIMSGLTERTLRTYIRLGVLNGEKRNGTWIFNDEEIGAFFSNEYVRPAIKAKLNALWLIF